MHSLYLLYYLKFFQIKRSLCSSTIAWKYMWFVLYLFSIKIESLKIRTVGFVSACRADWLRWCTREGVCVLLSRGELLCWSQNWSLLYIGIQATVLICPLVSHLLLEELILLELPQMSFGGVTGLTSAEPPSWCCPAQLCQLPAPWAWWLSSVPAAQLIRGHPDFSQGLRDAAQHTRVHTHALVSFPRCIKNAASLAFPTDVGPERGGCVVCSAARPQSLASARSVMNTAGSARL